MKEKTVNELELGEIGIVNKIVGEEIAVTDDYYVKFKTVFNICYKIKYSVNFCF